ncbi:MAG: diguanylate cyclase [Nitrospirae bacterium]|nr:diguanylate cyclase [Nitrospirota bacterium]
MIELKILIVDDDQEDIFLLKDYIREGLAGAKLTIKAVTSFLACLEVLQEEEFDVIFIDYRLGERNGIELIEEIRGGDCHRGTDCANIILLTGQGDEELAVTAMKKGARDYLKKSNISPDLIAAAIRSAMKIAEYERKQKNAEEALVRSETKYRELVTLLPAMVFEVGTEGAVYFANDTVTSITGYSVEEFAGSSILRKILNKCRIPAGPHDLKNEEIQSAAKDGSTKVLSLNSRARYSENGKTVISIVCICTDITELVELREKLHDLSILDELTGLYNRRGFYALAEQQLKLANRYKRGLLVIFLDLDGMKYINDNFGHAEGDRALIATAAILGETFRSSDLIGRTGGDEFIVIATGSGDSDIAQIRERLDENVGGFNDSGKSVYKLSLSVGIISYDPANPMSLDELISKADTLMYAHKNGKKRCK